MVVFPDYVKCRATTGGRVGRVSPIPELQGWDQSVQPGFMGGQQTDGHGRRRLSTNRVSLAEVLPNPFGGDSLRHRYCRV